jgi:hypothetical protein
MGRKAHTRRCQYPKWENDPMRRGAGLWLLLLVSAASVQAAEPNLRNLDVRGLQVGGTTTLTIDGDDLGTAPRLLLPFPAKQALKPGATDKRAVFEVALATDAPPGYHQLRVATEGGVSLPVVIGVDRLPQVPLAAEVAGLPVALHGVVNGSATVEARFSGKSGQKVRIEVEAQRLGSKLRPVVHLYNAKRRQLAWSWPTTAHLGDTRLEATLPEDGFYIVSVHDVEYAGPAPGFFRLRIGQWSFVDQVFPPVVVRGTPAVELLGSLPTRVELPPLRGRAIPLAWPDQGAWSGPRPFVVISPHTEVVEQTTDGKIQELPAGPVGVSGRLLTPNEEDRYRVSVTPNSRVRFEVFAERLGSPIDIALVIRNETGAEVARAEDSPGTLDPVLEYAVPDKVTALVVGVLDSQGRGGPRGVYRLVVEPKLPAAKRDFELFTPARRITLPAGGAAVVPVLIERRGYQGSVELSAEGLPAGVKLESTTIPAGTDGTLVTIQRGEAAVDPVVTRWRGRAEDRQERTVMQRGHPLERLQPWLATELALATSASKAADFQIEWRNLPADVALAPAQKLALPVKVTRLDANAPVRLTLVTSQLPPLVNNQPDPNQTLRSEKPVEIAAKATDGDLPLLIPPILPAPTYDVAVQAELLTPDKQRVLAIAFTPVRRMTVRMPLVVQLDGPPRLEAIIDPKTGVTFDIKGKIERREGLTGDVALALTGLPAGGRADPVTVKAGATDFVVKVILPATVAPGEITGLKLAGTIVADPKQPNVRVRSREVELTLVAK